MKKHKVEFIPEALEDIESAKQWYDQQSEGLGDKFVKSVENTIESIQKNPTR